MLAEFTPAPESKTMVTSRTLNWHQKEGRIEYRRYPMHLLETMVEKLMYEDEGVRALIKEEVNMRMATVGCFRSLLVTVR